MKLSDTQKTELLAEYLPLLLVSDDDVGLPLDPALYVARCALWIGQRPRLDDPLAWGADAGGSQRGPLVEKGDLTLDTLPLADIPFARRAAGELWLDCSGWQSASNVTALTDNRQANLPGLRSLFADTTPALRAEVCDAGSWYSLGQTGTASSLLGLAGDELEGILSDVIVINYMLLFPGHQSSGTQAFSDGTEYGTDNYEADWACFSVVLRRAANGALAPVFGAFSRHMRTQSTDFGDPGNVLRFRVDEWDTVPKVDGHACVLAAPGTHNLYPADLATEDGHPTPQSAGMGYGENLSDATNQWVDDTVQHNPQVPAAIIAVTLAKMLAGSALAGPWGALGGLIAGIAEASTIATKVPNQVEAPNPVPSEKKPPEGDLEDPQDKLKDEAYVLVAPSVTPDIAATVQRFISFPTAITKTLPWSSRSQAPVNRDKERFWPVHDGIASTGYVGRWGVRCSSDPYSRRAGDILPDFRMEIVRNLIPHLPPPP
jgi:hypothetical protein